jgi:hypothetical protein
MTTDLHALKGVASFGQPAARVESCYILPKLIARDESKFPPFQ